MKCPLCNGTGKRELVETHFWGMGWSHSYHTGKCFFCNGTGIFVMEQEYTNKKSNIR